MGLVVSTVIPTYNRGALLSRAVESCLADAEASGVEAEVLVVDDGSTDGTAAWLATHPDPRVRVLTQSNAGAQAARNLGMSAARGRYVRFLDSDDWLIPGITIRQVVALEEKGLDVAYADSYEAFEGAEPTLLQGPSIGLVDDFVAALLDDRWVPPFCYLHRREALRGVRWREDVIAACEDFDFILDVALGGARAVYVPIVAGCYFHHRGERISRRDQRAWCCSKLDVLARASHILTIRGEWTAERRRSLAASAHRLAQGTVGVYDDLFEESLALISEVQPDFIPEQRGRRELSLLLGLRRTEQLLYMRRRLRGTPSELG